MPVMPVVSAVHKGFLGHLPISPAAVPDGNNVSLRFTMQCSQSHIVFLGRFGVSGSFLFCEYETGFAPVSGRLEFYFQARLFHQAYSFLLLLGRAQLDDD